jgi:hypothetical protein
MKYYLKLLETDYTSLLGDTLGEHAKEVEDQNFDKGFGILMQK